MRNQNSSSSTAHRNSSTGSSSSRRIRSTHATLYYWPSILALISLGALNILLSKLNLYVGSTLAIVNFFLVLEWIELHSEKLTRKERFYFDEMNILQTCDKFEFNLQPIIEDDITGGGQNQCCGAYPKAGGLLSGLFVDQNQAEMQKFYQEHYGPEYKVAKQMESQEKAASKDDQKKQ